MADSQSNLERKINLDQVEKPEPEALLQETQQVKNHQQETLQQATLENGTPQQKSPVEDMPVKILFRRRKLVPTEESVAIEALLKSGSDPAETFFEKIEEIERLCENCPYQFRDYFLQFREKCPPKVLYQYYRYMNSIYNDFKQEELVHYVLHYNSDQLSELVHLIVENGNYILGSWIAEINQDIRTALKNQIEKNYESIKRNNSLLSHINRLDRIQAQEAERAEFQRKREEQRKELIEQFGLNSMNPDQFFEKIHELRKGLNDRLDIFHEHLQIQIGVAYLKSFMVSPDIFARYCDQSSILPRSLSLGITQKDDDLYNILMQLIHKFNQGEALVNAIIEHNNQDLADFLIKFTELSYRRFSALQSQHKEQIKSLFANFLDNNPTRHIEHREHFVLWLQMGSFPAQARWEPAPVRFQKTPSQNVSVLQNKASKNSRIPDKSDLKKDAPKSDGPKSEGKSSCIIC